MKLPLLCSGMLTLFAVALGACRSQPTPEPEFERWFIAAPFVELDALDPAHEPPVSLLEALGTARAHAPEGQLLSLELGTRDGRTLCRARFWEESGLHALLFDTLTGEVTLELSNSRMRVHGRELAPPATIRVAQDPEEAIRAALRATPGDWARSIELRDIEGKASYSVVLAHAGATPAAKRD